MPELADRNDAEMRAHAAGCPACAALLEDYDAVALGLRGVAADAGRVKASARVEAKLLAAFRGEAGLAAPPPARPRWAPIPMWAAAAAVVAFAILLLVAHGRKPPVAPNPAGVELATGDWTAGFPAAEEMDESGFLPLPNAARLRPNEEVNMVRVEVPRSAMIALGYTVSAERAAERVQADVVLGSDGLARAVRFLDE